MSMAANDVEGLDQNPNLMPSASQRRTSSDDGETARAHAVAADPSIDDIRRHGGLPVFRPHNGSLIEEIFELVWLHVSCLIHDIVITIMRR